MPYPQHFTFCLYCKILSANSTAMKTAMQELFDWMQKYSGKMVSADQVVLKAHKLIKKEQSQIIDARKDGLSIDDKLKQLHWYHRDLIKLYVFRFNRNAKKLSRETKIPYMSVWRTINMIKQKHKHEFELLCNQHYYNQTYKNQ